MRAAPRPRLASTARRGAWIAFIALVVLSPLRARITLEARPTRPLYGDYTDFLLFWSEAAALAVIALWVLSLSLERRPVQLGPRFLRWPVVGLLAMAWLGVPSAVDPALTAYTALHLTALAVLAVYVLNEVDRPERLVLPAALMVAAQALVGIAQVIAQRSVGLGVLGEHLLSPSLPVSVVTADGGTRLLRAYGLADHPNILGGVLAMALVLIGGTVATSRARLSAWRALAVALGAVALLLTFSRGAWLALAAGLAVFAGMRLISRDAAGLRRAALICCGGVLLTAPFAVSYQTALAARAGQPSSNATEQRSVDERVALSEATSRIIVAHPLLGTGIGALPLAMRAADAKAPFSYQPSSVVVLDVAAETGLAGGVFYLVLLVAPWLALWRIHRQWTAELAVASAALATVSVIGLFDYYTWTYSAGRIWAWMVLGLWAVAYRHAVSDGRDAA